LVLINPLDIEQWDITGCTVALALFANKLLENFWALGLEKFSVRVVVLERDSILLHEVVVEETTGCADSEASAISHSKALRHLHLKRKFYASLTTLVKSPTIKRKRMTLSASVSIFIFLASRRCFVSIKTARTMKRTRRYRASIY
jgi:hypothetical protein